MSAEFVPVVVKEVRQETHEAVSILLELPPDQAEKFAYKSGQYLTVRWQDNGKEHRRSYSISSVPEDPYLSITIKEVTSGTVSPLLCRKIKPEILLRSSLLKAGLQPILGLKTKEIFT
jgi:ferredoxin-NADP reductase